MNDNWSYVGEYHTERGRSDRLVAVYRTRPHPDHGHEDQLSRRGGWVPTSFLWRARMGREDNDYRDLTPAEAEKLVADKQREGEQILARSVHTLVRGFTAGGFADAAEQIRAAYADLRAGTAPAAGLHDLLHPEVIPANSAYPDDTDARLDFNRAWGMAQQLTRPAS